MIYVVIYIVLSYGYSFIETLEWYNKYIASNKFLSFPVIFDLDYKKVILKMSREVK